MNISVNVTLSLIVTQLFNSHHYEPGQEAKDSLYISLIFSSGKSKKIRISAVKQVVAVIRFQSVFKLHKSKWAYVELTAVISISRT